MTNFRDVIDRAVIMCVDYRLDKLYEIDINAFYDFLEGLMLNSIDMFNNCLNSLTYEEIEELDDEGEIVKQYAFTHTLTSKEIYILAYGILINWMERNKNDITQMNMHLSVKDFKSFSTSTNLKEKQIALDKMKEEYDRQKVKYQTGNLSKLSFFGGE